MYLATLEELPRATKTLFKLCGSILMGTDAYDQPMNGRLHGYDQVAQCRSGHRFVRSERVRHHLECRSYMGLMMGDTVRAVRHAAQNGYDAMVIGCFYDPGIEDARVNLRRYSSCRPVPGEWSGCCQSLQSLFCHCWTRKMDRTNDLACSHPWIRAATRLNAID